MGQVLRNSEPPPSIWQQHREILEAIVAGDAEGVEARILGHVPPPSFDWPTTLNEQ